MGASAAGLTCADFLAFFTTHGLPTQSRAETLAKEAVEANANPHFLVYWYLEGGWCGYDMFNPAMTPNNVIDRLDDISAERYRVLKWGEEGYGIYEKGNIRYGYLAEPGKDLFPDMAVLSSMHTGSGHSSDRLKVHMGSYKFKQSEERQPDERSVMQAFAEVYGQSYALPSLSWHWWLSDGEINEVQYTGTRGYYHALGPSHAHTIYAGTPQKLKTLIAQMQSESSDVVAQQIDKFLDGANRDFLKDDNLEAVRSYHSARQIYLKLAERGKNLDPDTVENLFTDPALREEFNVQPEDELITYRSVNGNKARSKFSPKTNVQAMMSYEMMRAGLSCACFIESRDVRRFDSHFSRKGLWGKDGTPKGMPEQTAMMKEDLWDPIHPFVKRLKETEFANSGTSLFDHTNIVVTSEFGRTIHGEVDGILEKKIDEEKRKAEIDGQDICQHWKVTSCAFLGGKVQGNRQYGGVGEQTLMAIPIMPDGSLDPHHDPKTGALKPEKEKHPDSHTPNHGTVYATALALSDISPQGRGRNEGKPLSYIKKA
ncbi:MAG: hypothetical protein ACI957_004361 [Verrucomicrobiales bacterium]|jgi:hypothetical protein